MFNLFKRGNNGRNKPEKIQLMDLDGIPLEAGDIVECLRYDMGMAKLIEVEKGYEYESLETGERVHYSRMVDASTSYQKVKKQ